MGKTTTDSIIVALINQLSGNRCTKNQGPVDAAAP